MKTAIFVILSVVMVSCETDKEFWENQFERERWRDVEQQVHIKVTQLNCRHSFGSVLYVFYSPRSIDREYKEMFDCEGYMTLTLEIPSYIIVGIHKGMSHNKEAIHKIDIEYGGKVVTLDSLKIGQLMEIKL